MKRTLFLFAGLFLLGIGLSGCGETQDVVAGDIADMYTMSPASLWPMDALLTQDVFADLYPFLDHDPAISRADFFPSILETIHQDDVLFYFPISYTLKGIWGLPEYICLRNGSSLHHIQYLILGHI